MDNETEVMALEERIIRRQMENTRSALTEKLQSLEQEVSETVEGATSAVTTVKETVEDTVGTVKESVQDAITAVKNSFDLPRQVQRYPWPMVGGSVAAGYLLGRLLGRITAQAAPVANGSHPAHGIPPGGPKQPLQTAAAATTVPVKSSWLAEWAKPLEPELVKLKAMALGTAMGLVRDMVTQLVPEQLAPGLADVIDSVTQKLGGETIRGPVVSHFTRTDTLDKGGLDEEFDAAEMGRPMGAAYR